MLINSTDVKLASFVRREFCILENVVSLGIPPTAEKKKQKLVKSPYGGRGIKIYI